MPLGINAYGKKVPLLKKVLLFLAMFSGLTVSYGHAAQLPPTRQTNEQLNGLVREPLHLKIDLPNGQQAILDAFVTRPALPGKLPVALLTHGTNGSDQSDRIQLNPNRFSSPAIAFARHGYAAVVVLRQGYGESTGTADDRGNSCKAPQHARAGEMARNDILAALNAIRQQPWASDKKAVLVGMSSGGFSVLAASALNPSGVQAIINVDGGRGAKKDGSVCDQSGLFAAIRSYGQTARIPTLWVYAANDRSFSPALGRQMFDIYNQAGGKAEFYRTEAYHQNGHAFLVSAPERFWWQPIAQFLRQNALPAAETVILPKVSLPLPALSPAVRQAFEDYQAAQTYEKAFATNGNAVWGSAIWARTRQAAENQALAVCQEQRRKNDAACVLYASGNQMTVARPAAGT